jgi:hypothetical protein
VVEEFVGGLGPDERVAAVVPAVDEPLDGGDQLLPCKGVGAARAGPRTDHDPGRLRQP